MKNNNMKKWQQILLTMVLYVAIFCICTVLFILLFHIPALNRKGVFFYRGCIFIVACSIIAMVLTIVAANVFKRLDLNWKDVLVVTLVFFSFTLGYFSVGPVPVERSISVFLLSYLDEVNDQDPYSVISAEELEGEFIEGFMYKAGEFEKRYNEQMVTGNIMEKEDENGKTGFVITERGSFFVDVFRLVSKIFGMGPELVYPLEN